MSTNWSADMNVQLKTTPYFDDFLRYFEKASLQQRACNLGPTPHNAFPLGDALMERVTLYDVVERKYAGFSQIINDCFYGCGFDHPYDFQASAGLHSKERDWTRQIWMDARNHFDLEEWLYVFILHRVTGSGINYAKQPSGYHNTILMDEEFASSKNIDEMRARVLTYDKPMYTSVGYQFPKFPKPEMGLKRGGDWFLYSYAPRLAADLAAFLDSQPFQRLTFRQIGEFMFDWNKQNGLSAYRFQYAAVIADIADWFPSFVHLHSPFYYGTNAKECIKYLAEPASGCNEIEFLDAVMMLIYEKTGSVPYNAEDVCCDYIRWVENYVKPTNAYANVCLDTTWSSSEIHDHPRGRQRKMLELGLVKSFNGLKVHPSDHYILDLVGLKPEVYKKMVADGSKGGYVGRPLSFQAGLLSDFL